MLFENSGKIDEVRIVILRFAFVSAHCCYRINKRKTECQRAVYKRLVVHFERSRRKEQTATRRTVLKCHSYSVYTWSQARKPELIILVAGHFILQQIYLNTIRFTSSVPSNINRTCFDELQGFYKLRMKTHVR